MIKKLLHEPLFHFLILGGLLFFFYSLSQNEEENTRSIIVSKARVAQLTSAWEKKFFRSPTPEEKQKMIDNEIYTRVFSNEALKLGLDKNDNEIKIRLAQKMEFIAYDTYTLPTPSDEVLKKFMLSHPEKYEKKKIHFTQTIQGMDTGEFEKEYTLTKFEASNIFGQVFAEALFNLNADKQEHKVESDYGVHNVLVISKLTVKPKDFNLIKEKLKDDYLNNQKQKKNRDIYEKMKSQYIIRVEEK